MSQDQFTGFVLDQLSAIPELRARAMFGGQGLYSGTTFFGILYQGRFYLHTDERTRRQYQKLGMAPFTYEQGKKIVSMNYFEVPAGVLENRSELAAWAAKAIASRQKPRAGKADV